MGSELKLHNQIIRLGNYDNISLEKYVDKLNNSGCYVFTSHEDFQNKNNKTYYVGKSISNLKCRMLESFFKYINKKINTVFIHCFDTYSGLDVSLLELYLINKLNPMYNTKSKYKCNIDFEAEITLPIPFKLKSIVKFKNTNKKTSYIISDNSGFYTISENNNIVYFGISILDLKKRSKNSQNQKVLCHLELNTFECVNKIELEMLEIIVLSKLKPKYNVKDVYNFESVVFQNYIKTLLLKYNIN